MEKLQLWPVSRSEFKDLIVVLALGKQLNSTFKINKYMLHSIYYIKCARLHKYFFHSILLRLHN